MGIRIDDGLAVIITSGSLLTTSSGRGKIDGPDEARILSLPRGGR